MKIRFLTTPEQKARLTGPLKLFKFYKQRRSRGKKPYSILELNIKRLFIGSTALFVFSYISATIGLYFWVARQEHNQIKYTDIALPHRWSQLNGLAGQTRLKQAFTALEEKEYKLALSKLRSGLAKYPNDFEARAALAQIYAAIKRPVLAIDILKVGFDYGYPTDDYVANFFQYTFAYHQYETANLVAEKLMALPEIKSSKEKYNELLEIRVKALMEGEDYASLLMLTRSTIADGHSKKSFHAAETYALIKQGLIDEAIELIETYQIQGYEDPKLDLLYLDAIFETQNNALIEKTYAQLKAKRPEFYKVRQEYIIHQLSHGHFEKAEEELNELAWMFGHEAAIILEVSSRIAHLGYSDFLDKFMSLPLARNEKIKSTLISYKIQALLAEQQWEEALRTNALWLSRVEDNEAHKNMSAWVNLLIETILDDNQIKISELKAHLKSNRLPHQIYLQTARAFESLNDWNSSVDFLNMGLAHYPFHKQISKVKEVAQNMGRSVNNDRSTKISSIMSERQAQQEALADERKEWMEDYKRRVFHGEKRAEDEYVPTFNNDSTSHNNTVAP